MSGAAVNIIPAPRFERRRGLAVADGAFLIFPTEEGLRTSLSHISNGAKRANRDLGEVDIVAYVFTCVTSERQAAIETSPPDDRLFRPAAALSQPLCTGRIFAGSGSTHGCLEAE